MHSFFRQFLLLSVAVFFSAVVSTGQSPRPTPRPLNLPATDGDRSDRQRDVLNDPMEEMRSRIALKAEQKEYDTNVARAREVSELGIQVLDAFRVNKTISPEETKKLERIEKLTKKIRDDAGGQDREDQDLELPNTLETAVKKVADLTGEMRKDVEKTPRKVVSAVVIDRANNLIGLIRYVLKGFH